MDWTAKAAYTCTGDVFTRRTDWKFSMSLMHDTVHPLLYAYKLYTGLKYSMTYQHAICRRTPWTTKFSTWSKKIKRQQKKEEERMKGRMHEYWKEQYKWTWLLILQKPSNDSINFWSYNLPSCGCGYWANEGRRGKQRKWATQIWTKFSTPHLLNNYK